MTEEKGRLINMVNIFKGFIEVKDKKAVESFKNAKNLKNLNEVKNLNGYAGVLAKNTILIDIDDKEQSDILYKILKDLRIKSLIIETSRGKHFYFKNTEVKKCFTNTNLAIGLKADIKSGFTNCYGVLKNDGLERKILENPESLDELPKWLVPINSNMDFINLEAGEGRNQCLFGYILPLQTNGFNKEEAREVIRLINEYILKEPLSEDELETILRDEAFSKEIFFKNKTFLFDDFAKFLIANDYVIKLNNQLHVYHNGVYFNNDDYIEKKMIEHIPRLSAARRSETLKYINLLAESKESHDENLIAFKNGIFDITSNELLEFNPDYIITNLINWNYDSEAYNELTDKTLDKLACGDKEIRALLEEMIGYCFFRRNELRKAFVLIGGTQNGKSTFLDLIAYILGDSNISSLDLKELDQRFKTAELFGKLANIGDDIGDSYIPDTAIFKKLVSGDRLNVERKGQDPFDFNNYSKLIFSANNIPRIGSGQDSSAIMNRLIIIPFNARFSKSDPDFDPFIKYKLRQESSIEYLIKLGLEGLKRVLTNEFTISEKVERELRDYEITNNPMIEFLEEVNPENKSTKDVYKAYKEFCLMNGNNPVGHTKLSQYIKSNLDLEIVNKKIGGKVFKTFVKI